MYGVNVISKSTDSSINTTLETQKYSKFWYVYTRGYTFGLVPAATAARLWRACSYVPIYIALVCARNFRISHSKRNLK